MCAKEGKGWERRGENPGPNSSSEHLAPAACKRGRNRPERGGSGKQGEGKEVKKEEGKTGKEEEGSKFCGCLRRRSKRGKRRIPS